MNLLYGKTHHHHSHVTGEILGYSHNICNLKVRENIDFFLCLLIPFSVLNSFFIVKGNRLCVWRTKNLCIAYSNLTNVNYANIGDRVKLTDTLKYNQQSLSLIETSRNSYRRKKVN